MGHSSNVISRVTGKKYLISTTEDRRTGAWQITVSERKFFGSSVVFSAGALDEEQARLVHFRMEEVVKELPPSDWEHARLEILKAVLTGNVGDLRKPPKREAIALVEQEKIGEAIVLSLAQKAGEKLLISPEFEADLKVHWREDHANVVRTGYYARIIELNLVGARVLVPLGEVNKILSSDKSRLEKIELITHYLDEHDMVGLGNPIAPYVFAPINEVRSALQQVVDAIIEANRLSEDQRDMHNEILHRHLAYGYVRRVAEELVERGSFPIMSDAASGQSHAGPTEREPTQIIKWDEFHNKPNTPMTLAEKARIIAALIANQWDISSELAAAVIAARETNNQLGEKEIQQARVETAIILLRMVDEIAFAHLGANGRETFMEMLEVDVGQALRGVGVEPEEFWKVLKERLEEYAQYRWLHHNMDKGMKDFLPWDFASKVADFLGVGPNAFFNMGLGENLLEWFVTANLPELLRGRPTGLQRG
jgi:hypothetical protein